jgi:hypothetical protein
MFKTASVFWRQSPGRSAAALVKGGCKTGGIVFGYEEGKSTGTSKMQLHQSQHLEVPSGHLESRDAAHA